MILMQVLGYPDVVQLRPVGFAIDHSQEQPPSDHTVVMIIAAMVFLLLFIAYKVYRVFFSGGGRTSSYSAPRAHTDWDAETRAPARRTEDDPPSQTSTYVPPPPAPASYEWPSRPRRERRPRPRVDHGDSRTASSSLDSRAAKRRWFGGR